ncbi:complement receptor type 2 isoform X7 [Oryzias latipes]|uniref:complement receptor type 2 isoform X7 n=1 Tax=Oryzias latipes TaxID=8090 RepID=UPI0009DA8942|nr:complement receptor type 2 isoform X7 [Oryzias latipes]
MEVVLNASGLRKLRSLLLIHLFAVNAAADCLTPPTTQHDTDLSEKSRMVDDYREGVQLQLECVSGYVRKSGTGNTTCNSGNWTKSDLICTRKDCGPPRDQPHMKFNLSQGTLFGDAVQVLCDKGYLLSGVTFKQCLSFGWFGKANCFAVVCKTPPEVANGLSSWSGPKNPKYGETVQYSCKEGYTLFGNSSITCDENGGYSPGPPECKETTSTVTIAISTSHRNKLATTQIASTVSPSQEAVVCKTPPEVANASSSWSGPKNPKYGETVQYSCKEGYTLFGNSSITCDENGGYSPGPPECKVCQYHSPLHVLDVPGINTNKESVSVPVIISLTAVFLVIIIVIGFLYMLHQKKKGSYDTGEDLKPELLQFQNL